MDTSREHAPGLSAVDDHMAMRVQFTPVLLASKLREHTPARLHKSLEKPSEPLSVSTAWAMITLNVSG